MAKQTINIGTVANDGTGDAIRDSFDKVNDNFDEIYGGTAELTKVTTNEIEAGTDDLTITLDANKTLALSQPVYRDEFPVYLTAASGVTAPDLTDYTIGGVYRRMYSFDGTTTTEGLTGAFEIPHDYMYGEDIEAHLHVRPATTGTGTFKFTFNYEHSPAQGAPVSKTPLTLTYEITSDKQYYNLIILFGVLEDGFQIGDMIGFNLVRDPTDSEDTYTGDMIFSQVALHVPCDTNGSRQRYVK